MDGNTKSLLIGEIRTVMECQTKGRQQFANNAALGVGMETNLLCTSIK